MFLHGGLYWAEHFGRIQPKWHWDSKDNTKGKNIYISFVKKGIILPKYDSQLGISFKSYLGNRMVKEENYKTELGCRKNQK